MKTVDFPKFKDYTDQLIRHIQPKRDGHLAKIRVENNKILVLSKNDKDITEKVLSIAHLFDEIVGIPNNSIVWGELHCPGVFASSVPTMLNDSDPNLGFTAFAAPILNGKDMCLEHLDEVNRLLDSFGLTSAETRSYFPDRCVGLAEQQIMLENAIETKLEGWVLKEGHMVGWYKLKPVKTVDTFVFDTYPSDSDSFPGGLKCIRIGVWKDGVIRDLGTTGNGFQKPWRMQFMSQTEINTAREKYVTDFMSKYGIALTKAQKETFDETMKTFDLPRLERDILLNRVCEIAYDSVAAKGKLRFPRFVRWREDKDIKNCTEDQLG